MEREIGTKQTDLWRPIADTVVTSNFASVTLACRDRNAEDLLVNPTRLRRLMSLSRMETPISITTASLKGRDRFASPEDMFDPRGKKTSRKTSIKVSPVSGIVPERGKWNIIIDSDELHKRAIIKRGAEKGEAYYRRSMDRTIRRALVKTIILDKIGPEMYFTVNYYMKLTALAANIYGLNNDIANNASLEYMIGHQFGLFLFFNVLFNGTFDHLRKSVQTPIPDDHNRREGFRRVLPTLPIEECAFAAAYLYATGKKLVK